MPTPAVEGIPLLIPLILLSALAFWRLHPVLFMCLGGIAIIYGCYMPDILTGSVTNNLSLAISLMTFMYSLVCVAFAFKTMFIRRQKE